MGLRIAGNATVRTYTLFENRDRVAEMRLNRFSTEIGLATYFATRSLFGLSLVNTYALNRPRVAPEAFVKTRTNLLQLKATTWIDTMDRWIFPTDGHFFYTEHRAMSTALGSDVSMAQHRLTWRSAYPLTPRFTLITDMDVAATFGDDPPLHERLTLGGLHQSQFEAGRFVGLLREEAAGRNLLKLSARLQMEAAPGRFVVLEANAGNTFRDWNWTDIERDYAWGFGVTLGANTPIGPVSVSLAHSSEHRELFDFNVGFRF